VAVDNMDMSDKESYIIINPKPIVSANRPDKCPDCGSSSLIQDEDVLDTWF